MATTKAAPKSVQKKKLGAKAKCESGKHPPRKLINLALQGGGAHGAFTWGVLDALLEDDRIDFEAITATSAGAVNGAVLIYGLEKGGPEKARELLEDLWRGISGASSMLPFNATKLLDTQLNNLHNLGVQFSAPALAVDFITRVFSPAEFNPFDLNPLRDLLDALVKFDVVRKNKKIKFFVNATNVKTGKARIFKTKEMTRDMILASACLPFLFKTIYIEGEPYWDGGYTGNPALYPLFYECTSDDLMLISINPLDIEVVPTHASDILDRVNEVSFNSSLMHEMRAIAFVKKLLHQGKLSPKHYKDVRVHMIEATDVMVPLGRSSKLNTDWGFISDMRDFGAETAKNWLKKNYTWIGTRSTTDIHETFL